jgi:predicted small lipoprotein YifL
MKRILFLLATLLIIGLGGCGQKDLPPAEEPPVVIPGDTIEVPGDTIEVPGGTIVMPPLTGEPVIFDMDITGKWERIAEGPDEDRIVPVEANGSYREFLPNGVHQGYWADSKQIYRTDSLFLYLYFLDNSDGVNDRIYKYAIINRDTLKLKHVYGIIATSMNTPEIFIYQRIK